MRGIAVLISALALAGCASAPADRPGYHAALVACGEQSNRAQAAGLSANTAGAIVERCMAERGFAVR